MSKVRIEPAPLGGSPLSRLAQAGTAPAEWYTPRPRTSDEWRARAERVRSTMAPDWFDKLAPAFGNSSGAAADRLARVVASQGIVITTGQQPGLFGGPVYTWSKALSALALADVIESETGIPAAPVFWAATDDSDFAEGAYTIVARTGGVDRLTIASAMPEGTRVADIPLPDMSQAFERLAAACGSAADARVLEWAARSYAPPATVGSAYVTLLRTILEPLGISVLDATHEALTRAAHPVLVRALHERERIARSLAQRSAALTAAGHSPQVADLEPLTLVFERKGLRRERIARARAAVTVATAEPGSLSPNVLLRPVVERALLPTVAYVAGPGEIAYFAQVSAVSEAIDADAPLAVPRWSATLIEPHIAEIMQRYDLRPDDFADPHAVETRLAREAFPAGISKALEQLRRDLAERLAAVRVSLQALDGMAPSATVDGTGRALEWRISRLERRITAAVKSRETALMRDLATVRASLYPGGVRQERALNLIPLLARHGVGLLEEMRDGAAAHARSLMTTASEPAIAT
ncbi:MAG TPA: bacillithiol biosynthesis cysteine-adding enzyme BshC [Gemmatimonadaceae bacterium]